MQRRILGSSLCLLTLLSSNAPVMSQDTSSTSSAAVVSLDQKPPKTTSGAAIATSNGGGGGVCWADPSADGRVVTSEFGAKRSHGSSPHGGVDMRARQGNPLYAVADGCVSFGNPTARRLIGVKMRVNDHLPNASVWYLHMSRVLPEFINDGRSGQCIPVKKGQLVGYAGNSWGTHSTNDSGDAHLHLSFYASGLMLNPLPYVGSTVAGSPEYNTIRDGSTISGGGSVSNSDGSGTKGSKLGFAVPRMCNAYEVKGTSQKTIPYSGSSSGSVYTANATAPDEAKLRDGQQRTKQMMGVDADGKAPASEVIDASNWGGGVPEEPDWDSYREMSFAQIMGSEISRRSVDNRWAESLMQQERRGLMIEALRIRSLRLAIQYEAHLTRMRLEAAAALMVAAQGRSQAAKLDLDAVLKTKSPIR